MGSVIHWGSEGFLGPPPAPGNGGHQVRWSGEPSRGPAPLRRRMQSHCHQDQQEVAHENIGRKEKLLNLFSPRFVIFFMNIKEIHTHRDIFGTLL